MIVNHRLHVVCTCPADEAVVDVYVATVEVVDRVLQVEEILEAVRQATLEPAYQEDVTVKLAKALKATVVTRGTHSGVETTCEEDGSEQ